MSKTVNNSPIINNKIQLQINKSESNDKLKKENQDNSMKNNNKLISNENIL